MKLESLAIGLMLAVGSLAWWLYLTPALEFDTTRLSALPTQVESWTSHDIPVREGVERILRADFNLQREYARGPSEPPVWLYVGYYGTERGGRPEHTPDVCYPSAGWEIVEESTVVLDRASDLHAVEYVVALEGHLRLVHYWYRNGSRTGMVGLLPLGLEHLRGRMADGRADGALVRISTPIEHDDADSARERLRAFAPLIDSQIASHWPDESPAS